MKEVYSPNTIGKIPIFIKNNKFYKNWNAYFGFSGLTI